MFGANRGLKSFTTAIFIFCGLFSQGCSPGLFFGDGQDSSINETPHYRKVPVNCQGLKVSDVELDVSTFRTMVDCLNSNGAIQPIADLVHKIDIDSDLEPIVHFGNEYLLKDKDRFYQIEKTFYQLKEKGLLDKSFYYFGKIIENEKFISNLLSLLKDATYQEGKRFHVDPLLLRAVEKLSEELTPESFINLIDWGITVSDAAFFNSLLSQFSSPSKKQRRLKEDITDPVLRFLKAEYQYPKKTIFDQVFSSIENGDLFFALDQIVPDFNNSSTKELYQFKKDILDQSLLMEGLFKTQEDLVSSENTEGVFAYHTMNLFGSFNKKMFCLDGAVSINNGALWGLAEIDRVDTSEVASFIQRANLVSEMFFKSFCDLPKELGIHYPYYALFSQTNSFEVMAKSIQAFHSVKRDGQHPLSKMFVDLLSHNNSLDLLPLMAELSDRNVWDDLFLLTHLPNVDSRKDIKSFVKFLNKKEDFLDKKSIFDVFAFTVARSNYEHFYLFIKSLRDFLNNEPETLARTLKVIRSSFYTNDVHPFVDVIREVMATTTGNESLYNTLFVVSEMEEFQKSISFVSDMAKDGRLKHLIEAMLSFFHKYAELGNGQTINKVKEPRFVSKARHNLSAKDLLSLKVPVRFYPVQVPQACQEINLNFSLKNYKDPQFHSQLAALLDCINIDSSHKHLKEVIHYLNESHLSNGKSFLGYFIELIQSIGNEMNSDDLQVLTDVLLDAHLDGRLKRVLDFSSLVFSKEYSSNDGEKGTIAKPAIELISHLSEKNDTEISQLQSFVESVLRKEKFPSALKYIDQLLENQKEPVGFETSENFDFNRIKRWVHNKECDWVPDSTIDAIPRNEEIETRRAEQIIEDYHYGITSWEWLDGGARKSWEMEDFRAYLEPLLEKISDLNQSAPTKNIIHATLRILKYFSLEKGELPSVDKQFTPDDLASWFYNRSIDSKIYSYFYSDLQKPKVRIMNSLDLLELVVTNADMQYILPENFSLKFLALVGESWADEPREIWPIEIKEKFKNCPINPKQSDYDGERCPYFLRDAAEQIVRTLVQFRNLLGIPTLPGCPQIINPNDDLETQIHETTDPQSTTNFGIAPKWVKTTIYNQSQIISLIEDNTPGADHPNAGGMKLLRNLFFELYYSSPQNVIGSDSAEKGWSNNLNVILSFVRLGLGRQAGRLLKQFEQDDQSIKDFFYALVKTAESPYAESVLRQLVVDDSSQELFWGVIEKVFQLLTPTEDQEQWDNQVNEMKQLSFFAVATLGQTERELRKEGKPGLINPLLRLLNEVIKDHSRVLIKNMDLFGDLLISKSASRLLRAFYESDNNLEIKKELYEWSREALSLEKGPVLPLMSLVSQIEFTPKLHQNWNQLKSRFDELLVDSSYQDLELQEILNDLMIFFQEQTDYPNEPRPLSTRIRWYFANRLNKRVHPSLNTDLDYFLEVLTHDPDKFNLVLETLSDYIKNGQLEEFLDLIERSLKYR